MTDSTPEQDNIEGIDDSTGQGWGSYPLEAVFVRNEIRTVGEVVRRIEAKRYVLNPDFQRDFVWNPDKQSRLIESCLMRLPLPVFYVAEAKDGRIIVVDGLQRLTTFKLFLANKFSLHLPEDHQDPNIKKVSLNQHYFKDLSITLQERILDTQLILYILDANAPERAKLDIFERVNGGEALTRQQMRNCLYNGQATRWLQQTAELESFKDSTSQTFSSKTMRDREAVNRFCGFRLLGINEFKGDLDIFLAETLEHMNKMSSTDLSDLQADFDRSMKHNMMLFGKHAFRKSLCDLSGSERRSIINIALFDVCSVIFSEINTINTEQLINKKQAIQEAFAQLLQNDDFLDTITSSTTMKTKVIRKFTLARQTLDGALTC
ncbi:MAG: DUF262 domain-containing protein [Magnetococcus sp. YQC-5]